MEKADAAFAALALQSSSSLLCYYFPTSIFLSLHVSCFISTERAWEELQQGGNTLSLPLTSLEKRWLSISSPYPALTSHIWKEDWASFLTLSWGVLYPLPFLLLKTTSVLLSTVGAQMSQTSLPFFPRYLERGNIWGKEKVRLGISSVPPGKMVTSGCCGNNVS